MAEFEAILAEDDTEKKRTSEINHNRNKLDNEEHTQIEMVEDSVQHNSSYVTEVIELPTDGRVEIVASRRFGRQVTSSRDKDEVTITLSHGDVVRVAVSQTKQHAGPDVLRRCGAMIPHGPAVLDVVVSGILFVYSFLLTLLVSHVKGDMKYLAILMIWFFYIILRMNMYTKDISTTKELRRSFWHFTGISFSVMFMYATMMIVFPILSRAALYDLSTTTGANVWNTASLLLPALKVSIALALLGMAARRSFHCGKIIQHTDIIKSILLDNVDIFNLIETLGLRNDNLPLIPKGSVLEISILIFCEVAFLTVVFEALVPYTLLTLDSKNVGTTRRNISIQKSKDRAIIMVYPYSLLILNLPFLAIRLTLFLKFNVFQLAYVIKNIASIIFGAIALIKAKDSLSNQQVHNYPTISPQEPQQKRISV